jgi:hypothetical protein
VLITLQYPLVSALTPLLLARSLSTRSTLQLHPRALPAATLAAVSSPRRRTAPIICAPCTLPLPLARDSYHVALALPSPSRVLAAHHTSKPVTPALVCLRSARADFRSATHQDLNLSTFDSSCRPVLSASLLQHHHIGATHSLLATISTTNYSPREHHSPSAASRLSQAHRRVFPGPLS